MTESYVNKKSDTMEMISNEVQKATHYLQSYTELFAGSVNSLDYLSQLFLDISKHSIYAIDKPNESKEKQSLSNYFFNEINSFALELETISNNLKTTIITPIQRYKGLYLNYSKNLTSGIQKIVNEITKARDQVNGNELAYLFSASELEKSRANAKGIKPGMILLNL